MKIAITVTDNSGIESKVSQHFGQSEYFLIVDIENNKIVKTDVIKNKLAHQGGSCLAVDELLKNKITHVITNGIGMNAQKKLSMANVKVYGYNGIAKQAVEEFLKNNLSSPETCKEHRHGKCH